MSVIYVFNLHVFYVLGSPRWVYVGGESGGLAEAAWCVHLLVW